MGAYLKMNKKRNFNFNMILTQKFQTLNLKEEKYSMSREEFCLLINYRASKDKLSKANCSHKIKLFHFLKQ